MGKQIKAMVFIFVCTSVAWLILGSVTNIRTYNQNLKLKTAVSQLWGSQQKQQAPVVYYQTNFQEKVETVQGAKTITEMKTRVVNNYVNINSSDINADLDLEHRKKGLLWYSTYKVKFNGKYTIENNTGIQRAFFFDYTFPNKDGIYDNFSFIIDNKEVKDLLPVCGHITKGIYLKPGETAEIVLNYESQGMDNWWYIFGSDVSQIENFNLILTTNFNNVDFPDEGISPTKKIKTDKGWKLIWKYSSLISGIQIGVDLPKKLNPGPFASKVSYFAPVSLFLFLFLMFIITTIKKVNIHPMNYFFISAAFFSFHLLMSYLANHMAIQIVFIICSAVSIFLVISYMRLVVGTRFALIEIGIAQFVYLVMFSFAFFLEGYTGLSITICCILTLFVVMQFTGKIDWSKEFINKVE